MKKQIVITALISLLVGVILTAVGYSAYIVVSTVSQIRTLEAQVQNNTAVLTNVVDFLNKATAPATKGSAATE